MWEAWRVSKEEGSGYTNADERMVKMAGRGKKKGGGRKERDRVCRDRWGKGKKERKQKKKTGQNRQMLLHGWKNEKEERGG